MIYDPLADVLEAQKADIARRIAIEGLRRGLKSYKGLTVDAFAGLIEKTIAMVGRYCRNGNPDEYQAYVQKLVRDIIVSGRSTDDALVVTEIMIVELDQVIAREWPGEDNRIERERYLKRVDNMHNFGQITFKATRLALKQEGKA